MHNYILPFNSIYYVIFSCLITIWRWHRDSILLWRHYTHYVQFSRNQILWSEFWANFAADDVTFPSSEKTEKFVVCNTNHGALNALHLVMRVWLRWDERDLHFTRYGGVTFFKCTGHYYSSSSWNIFPNIRPSPLSHNNDKKNSNKSTSNCFHFC